jgi:hypothetical protein
MPKGAGKGDAQTFFRQMFAKRPRQGGFGGLLDAIVAMPHAND